MGDDLNNINLKGIDELSKMSKQEIEDKLKEAIQATDDNKLKGLLNNIDADQLKQKLQTTDMNALLKVVNTLKQADTGVLDRVKNLFKK